jgi:hypothetical protein
MRLSRRECRLLIVVAIAFCAVLASAADRLDSPPIDSKKLVEIARRHHVHMPPKAARLVLAYTGWGRGNLRLYSPAFLLEERADGSVLILRGMQQLLLEKSKDSPLLIRTFATGSGLKIEGLAQGSPRLVISEKAGYLGDFNRLSAFVCCIQLAERGDEAQAQAIWKEVSKAFHWADGINGEHPAEQLRNPETVLARCIFDDLKDRVIKRPDEWSATYDAMKSLLGEFPALGWDERRGKRQQNERGRLLGDLAETLKPHKPPMPNSVEALLLDWARRPNRESYTPFDDNETSAPATAIVVRGFDAIPELLVLLDDPRIVMNRSWGTMWQPIPRVGDLAEMLLEEIAGRSQFSIEEHERRVEMRAWCQRAKGNESDYFSQAAFARDGDAITGVEAGPVFILAHKDPSRLTALVEEFNKRAKPDAHPWPLTRAVAKASLPKETRVALLSKWVLHGSLVHQRWALEALASVDIDQSAKLALTVLANIPTDATGPYMNCPEAEFTRVVMQLPDDRIWRRWLEVAKRSGVGLRLQMMQPVMYYGLPKPNRSRLMAFLAAFLDDRSVRDLSANAAKYEGLPAACEFRRIEVRDYAALALGRWLRMPDEPDESWTPARWSALRDKVRAKLLTMNLPQLETGR